MLRLWSTCTLAGAYRITVAVLLLTAHAVLACPSDVSHAVFACFGSLTKTTSSNFLVAGGDVIQLNAKCKDGSFTRTASCVNQLFSVCRKRKSRMKELEYLIDPLSVRRSFKQLCDNFKMYSDNSPCLKHHSQTIQKCVKDREKLFERFQKESYSNGYVSKQHLSDLICNFMTGVTRCIEREVRAFCDCRLADFIIDFMTGLNAPSCPRYSPATKCTLSTAAKTSQPLVLTLITSIFSILFSYACYKR